MVKSTRVQKERPVCCNLINSTLRLWHGFLGVAGPRNKKWNISHRTIIQSLVSTWRAWNSPMTDLASATMSPTGCTTLAVADQTLSRWLFWLPFGGPGFAGSFGVCADVFGVWFVRALDSSESLDSFPGVAMGFGPPHFPLEEASALAATAWHYKLLIHYIRGWKSIVSHVSVIKLPITENYHRLISIVSIDNQLMSCLQRNFNPSCLHKIWGAGAGAVRHTVVLGAAGPGQSLLPYHILIYLLITYHQLFNSIKLLDPTGHPTLTAWNPSWSGLCHCESWNGISIIVHLECS